MSALTGDFTDCTVFIYDIDGTHLANTVVKTHDKGAQQIQVGFMPFELGINDNCKLLILSSPTPCEYQGKVKRVGGNQFIAMFQGQEKESRSSSRYPVNTPALIDALIVDGEPHVVQTPIEVTLINISTSGVRFRAPFYSFEDGDSFQMHMVISNNKKRIIAKVVNHLDNEPDHSDYGCLFLEIE